MDKDKVRLAKIELNSLAARFVAECPCLEGDVTLEVIKEELIKRFKESQLLRFYYIM